MREFNATRTNPPHYADGKSTDGGERFMGVAVTALLAVHVLLLAWGSVVHSPTLTEPAHLVGGISIWRFGRFDIFCVNPPLVRMTAAAPVLLAGAREDWGRFFEAAGARPEFAMGADFVAVNGQRSMWLFTLARWACIPFSVAGGYVCFRWARDVYGGSAGLLSLTLWCFSPNIIAHGQLITPDAAATSLGLAACYTFWRWLKLPTWERAVTSGLVLGLALLTKFTLVVYFVLWPVLWLVFRWPRLHIWSREARREAVMLAALLVTSLYVINLGYGFSGTGARLGDFRFVSAALGASPGSKVAPLGGGNRFRDHWTGRLLAPLPKDYILGIDLQKYDFETEFRPSYLRGEFRQRGWWYYYVYALAIKVPLGTWLLLGCATILRLWRTFAPHRGASESTERVGLWRDEVVMLAPAAVVLALVSCETSFSRHMRYVLPALPYVFVWLGQLGAVFSQLNPRQAAGSPATRRRDLFALTSIAVRRRLAIGWICAAVGWSVGSSLSVYPHSLSYFNELVGGPVGGPAHLIDSNVDWGQDLLKLKRWLDEHPEARPFHVFYYGYFDPKHAGIDYSTPDSLFEYSPEGDSTASLPPGWYAASASLVRGFPYSIYRGDGTRAHLRMNSLARLQKLEPVAMAGYSIAIYHVAEAADP